MGHIKQVLFIIIGDICSILCSHVLAIYIIQYPVRVTTKGIIIYMSELVNKYEGNFKLEFL